MSNIICECGANSWGLPTSNPTKMLNPNCFNCKVAQFCPSCMITNKIKPSPNPQINKTPLRCANNDCRKEFK